MLLCIDIGNTNITLGLFRGSELHATFRLQSRREQTSDEYAIALVQLLALHALAPAEVGEAVIASVVSALQPVLVRAVQRAFGRQALVVTSASDVGVAIAVERPSEVGIDRIVNVAAVRALGLLEARATKPDAVLAHGAIVVDLGTATTLDCLSPSGEFVGGVIVPGMRLSFDALVRGAPKLPDVELVAPPRTLGKNTRECLQSGIMNGYASLIDGLVAKLRAELPFECRVLATGGLAPLLAPLARSIEAVDLELTLRGLAFIGRRLASARGEPTAP